ncbi:DUF5977 domain-containing protein [Epilithonimonas zeae]|uniref:DUF5977 domain-containing protein n=1 Tax=Epilithonimonas zeae TaxID=1416779 RepID=A0A1N6GRJ6_9FLAO|nr:DUF5977 domain-containing protein [Epilithonimonas zeae]SIO10159.1 hypothetical protein SAMN05444409_2008 [Epilithonimonas zeae]
MKTKNTYVKLFSLSIFISFTLFYGQANYSNYYFPEPPKSPSSEMFLKYGNVQNSEYSGANSPSINLFNLKSGQLSVPINLNYISGNGIKVTDEAGYVGLGWLISFPTIVQSIYGYDDFSNAKRYRLDFAKSTLSYPSNFPLENGPTNFNQFPSFDTYGYFMATNNNVPRNGSFTSLYSDFNYVDMQQDVFILNLFGEKVEFVISNFDNYTFNNYDSIYFTSLNKKGYSIKKTSEGFTIKDSKGFIYRFNDIEDIGQYTNGSLIKANGRNFLLSEIKDINNNIISFTYNSTDIVTNQYSNSWFLNYTTNLNQNYCNQGTSGDLEAFAVNDPAPVPNPNRFGGLNTFSNNSISNATSQQRYLYPTSITGNNGKLILTYSDRTDFATKKLDKITLLTNNNIIIDECQFNYDYFLPQTVDATNLINNSYNQERNKRLKLISLQKKNEEKYIFSYNETLLPPKYSFATDYWGYSNGGFNNKTAHLNPSDFNYSISIPITEINNNKKNSDLNYTKSAILEKIQYPTKGYSKFIYELNEASNLFYQFNNYKYNKGNGLRLSEQKNFDINNNPLGSIRFEYEGGLTPNPIHNIRQDKAEEFVAIGDCAGRPVVKTLQAQFVAMYSSSINNTFSLSSGSGVGYQKVIKREVDINNNVKGKTETTYSNNEDIHYSTSSYTRPIFLPSVKGNKLENGTILNISTFDNFIKIREEKYSYSLQNSQFFYGVTMIHPMFNYYKLNSFGQNGDPAYFTLYRSAIGYYPIYSTETILKDKETIEYINGDSLSTKTDYTYDNYNLISSKTTNYPTTEKVIEGYKYSHQNSRFYNANILSTIVEKSITKVPRLVFKQVDQYNDSNHFNPTSSLFESLISGSAGNDDVTYDRYDSNGNLLQYTKKGVTATIIWGYNKTQPIAFVEGATYPDPNNTKSTDVPQSLITTIVDASNIDASKASGTDETELLTALDNFRKDPLTANFKITTYTYDPLIGVRSITSAAGLKEFYKYDTNTNKLEKIFDQKNNIVKEYRYKYAPIIYYNSTKSQSFIRNNCGSSYIGGSYIYTVPENKYSSYDSQAAADQQAQAEVNNFGQSTANIYGSCTYINCSISMMNNITGGGSVSVVNTDYRVQLSFSSGVGRPWTTDGVIVGKINGSCIPSTPITKTSYNGGFIWSISVKANGELLVKKLEGLGVSGVPNNTTYNIEISYPLN